MCIRDRIIEANASKAAPTWLDVNKDNKTAKVLRMPVQADLDYDIEEHLIVDTLHAHKIMVRAICTAARCV